MYLTKKFHIGISFILFCILLSACGPSPEELATTSAAQTAAAVTDTPGSTSTPEPTIPPPTDTPIPTETNTPSPTYTPTIRPTFSPETLIIPVNSPIRIAYLLWENNPVGIDSIRGIEIAISEFGGAILGHPIELIGYDSECQPFAAMRGSQILMQDETILGVIGTSCSVAGLQAAPIISDNHRVMISPSNSSPELTASDTHAAGYFRTAPNDLVQIEAAAQYAFNELGVQSLAIVRGATNPYQRLYSIALCEVFTELGGECVLDKAKDAGSTYVAPIINSLVEANPDVVYFMGTDYQEGAAFLSEARKITDLQDTALFFWETYNHPEFLNLANEDVVGVYVTTTSWEIDRETDIYQTFLITHTAEYGEDPVQIYHPYAYDATTLLLMAIAQVAVPSDDGSLMVDPFAVQEALYGKIEFQGLSGFIYCSEFGDCSNTSKGRVYQFTSGDPNTFQPGPADSVYSNPAQVWP